MRNTTTIRYRNIADQARKDFENNFVEQKLLKKLYCKYNNIKNIDVFMKRAGRIFPRLNCGVASVYLQYLLKKGTIINGKYGEENHTFLSVDNIIIDITADQYGGPKVYVGPVKGSWRTQ